MCRLPGGIIGFRSTPIDALPGRAHDRRMARRVPPLNSLVLLMLMAPLYATLSACTDGSMSAGAEQGQRLVLGFSPIVSWGGWSGANADSVRKAASESNVDVVMEDTRY